MRYVWRTVLGIELAPFPRLTHRRSAGELRARQTGPAIRPRAGRRRARSSSIPNLPSFDPRSRLAARVVALRYPGGAALSRRDFDALTETAKEFGGKGMVWIALGSRRSQIVRGAFPDRRADRERSQRRRREDGRCAVALCRCARARVRRCRQDAQRGRRALQPARSQDLRVCVGHRFSVPRDRRGDGPARACASSVYGTGARRLGVDRSRSDGDAGAALRYGAQRLRARLGIDPNS